MDIHCTTTESHDKWRRWLSKTISEARTKLDKAQVRYKRNYDRLLRRQREEIREGDSVFLRVERRNEADTRHKLAAVADGPFQVQGVSNNTVVIARPDNTVERVSRDQVTLAPEQLPVRDLQNRTRQ